jgi:hypothetical protein
MSARQHCPMRQSVGLIAVDRTTVSPLRLKIK